MRMQSAAAVHTSWLIVGMRMPQGRTREKEAVPDCSDKPRRTLTEPMTKLLQCFSNAVETVRVQASEHLFAQTIAQRSLRPFSIDPRVLHSNVSMGRPPTWCERLLKAYCRSAPWHLNIELDVNLELNSRKQYSMLAH